VDVLYSRCPGGRVGVALLLLRVVSGVGLVGEGIRLSNPIATSPEPTGVVLLSVALVGSAILLIIGLQTSVAGSVAAVCTIAAVLYGSRHLDLLGSDAGVWFCLFALVLFISSSLALLGPGSLSLDARLSGWRTISVSSAKTDGPHEWDTWA
jgi:uncharacterized membrane protein YphA (DoxX/SURF4 family)